MGLQDVADRNTADLSLGLQQRVSVASMLAIEPSVLVLDEPTNFLDPPAAENLFRLLTDLSRTRGMSIIVIEHDLERLRAWADLAVVLERGRVARMGAPGEVLSANQAPTTGTSRNPAADTAPQPEPDTPATLTIDGLSFAYDTRFPLLHNLSLTVRRGEIVALIGENGTGKSTLLKLIKGLLKPGKGTVHVPGNRPNIDTVGLVFQNPDDQIFAHSVTEECAYVLRNRGHARKACAEPVHDALQTVGLAEADQRDPSSLSFGEKRRLTVASVLVDHPAILCLDEPTVALDDNNLNRLAGSLTQTAEQGAAILFATHDLAFAQRVAHRIVELRNGHLNPRDKL
jgi:energy-coupling factor transport system ATP-binding protein